MYWLVPGATFLGPVAASEVGCRTGHGEGGQSQLLLMEDGPLEVVSQVLTYH